MSNYAQPLPRDTGGAPMQEYPAPRVALAQYAVDNASASSVISVSHDTTAIEIAAIGASPIGAVMRWVTTGDTQASIISAANLTENFDHVIGNNQVRRFVIPIESFANPGGSVVGINRGAGLYQRVAVKSTGVGSVLVTEY